MTVQELTARITFLENEEKTLKASLDAEKTKVTALEGEKTTLTTRAQNAEAQVKTLEGEKTALSNQLTESKSEADKLKNEAKDADKRGREIAAANGTEGTKKEEGAAKNGTDKDGAALFAKYEGMMKAGKFAEASEFYAKNEAALDAYAASLDKRRSDED